NIYASKISITKPNIPLSTLYLLTRENIPQLVSFFNKHNQQDLKLIIKDALLSQQPNNQSPLLITNLSLHIKNNNALLNGSIDHKATKLTATAHWNENNYFLDDLILQNKTDHSRFWGVGENKTFQLNGYSSINTKDTSSIGLISQLKKRLNQNFPETKNAKNEHKLEEIDCILSFDYPTVNINKFTMLVNKNPFNLKGQAILTETTPFDMQLSFDQTKSKRATMTRVSVSGKTINQILFLDASINKIYKNNIMSLGAFNSFNLNIDDFSLDFNAYPKLRMTVARGEASWDLNDKKHKVQLNNAAAFMRLTSAEIQTIKIKSQIYNGSLDGKLWIDTSTSPPVIASELSIKQADTEKFSDILPLLSTVIGKCDTNLILSTYPKFNIDGNISITNARLEKNPLFNWIADSFDLPALSDIQFNHLESKILVNSRKSGLYDINTDSNALKLKGFYAIKNDGLVSSKLTLLFNRDMLKNSSKCKILHKSINNNSDYIDFDIQLSGDQDNVNFLWLDSETKTAIQEKLPNFIERIIDRRVDESLASK
ncbi:hypothetical protein ACFL49_03600, partial [Candidatus Omnitrophota bacterium]